MNPSETKPNGHEIGEKKKCNFLLGQQFEDVITKAILNSKIKIEEIMRRSRNAFFRKVSLIKSLL